MMIKERVAWIDIARGIGILLVLYAHGLSSDSYRHIFYAFHMPLFFFLSGVVFHHKKHEHFLPFLKKAAKNILLPYFLFAFISFVIWYLNYQDKSSPEIMRQFTSIFYGSGRDRLLGFNVVLWFLPSLFVTQVLFATFTRISTKRTFLLHALLLSSIAGFSMFLLYPTIKLPFGGETALTGVVFFGVGYFWNTVADRVRIVFDRYALPLFAILALVCIFFAQLTFNTYELQIDMRVNRLHNYYYFYIAALSGIFSCVALSVFLKKQSVLEYLGRHSLVLFVWHLIIFSQISKVLRLFMTPETIDALRNTYFAPLYTVISICVILFINHSLRRIAFFKRYIRNP